MSAEHTSANAGEATPAVSANDGPNARRPRAPTITVDTSAVNRNAGTADSTTDTTTTTTATTQPTAAQAPMLQLIGASDDAEHTRTASFESRESRPTSPHNVSSPTTFGNNSHLMVPMQRKRGASIDTDSSESSAGDSSTYVAQSSQEKHTQNADGQILGAGDHPVLPDDEALVPDPGTEADFTRENNPFAFTPGQLNKMLNPKSLGAFHAMGGDLGLERGLRSDINSGLSSDEQNLQGTVSFTEATTNLDKAAKAQIEDPQTGAPPMAVTESAGTFQDRKRIYGDNVLPQRKSRTIFELAWIAYNDKVLILLTICAVIALALGIYQAVGIPRGPTDPPSVEWVEGVAIVVAIVVVVAVGALNDWQKERQFVKLNAKKDDRNVKVIRSGATQQISVHDILAGDLLQVEPGDILPVDGIFVAGHGVRCDESSATGESDIMKKTAASEVYKAMESGAPLKKLDPFMISGAKVTEGFGRMIVTSTGVNSSYGKTMLSLREDAEATPLQVKLNSLAEYIAKLGGSAALLLFIVLLIKFLAALRYNPDSPAQKGQEFLNILIQAVIIVVVAVPEGLPLAVTLALAFATKRMLKDNNLVRVLRSCETMGNATCICSDKTGTLTQNVMTVVAGTIGTSNRFTATGSSSSEDKKISADDDVTPSECVKSLSSETKSLLKDSIAINSTAFEGEDEGKLVFIGSKTETALLTFAKDLLGMDKISIERSNAQIAQMIPFDSERKCMAVVIKLEGHGYRLLVKGASEIMLERCTNVIEDPTRGITATPLSASHNELLGDLINEYASRSLRTIGFIYRDYQEWPPRHARRLEDDKTQAVFDDVCKHMTFLGLVGIQDPLRPGVKESVQDCLKAGVAPRMVTGDNINTARAIAKECGILTPGGEAIEGPEFRKMSKFEQLELIPRLQIIARSSPEDKRVLVRRLKEMGETVAVTGDGTNDAPALKAADVGFSMNIAGTEVAKEASDIILMDDNFSSIVKALMWGRAVNDAVRKFLQFQITVNITAVLLAFISAVSNDQEQSVLSAVQLLWVNLIMDTMAALALATDPPTRQILDRKPEKKSAPLISMTMWKMIIGQAIYQLVITLVLYFAGNSIFKYAGEHEINGRDGMIFNTFVWMQIFNALNNRRLDSRFNVFEGIQRNYFFIGIFLIMIGGQILIMFVGGQAFRLNEPQQPDQWAIAIILGAISLPVGVVIRLIPNEMIERLIPAGIRRRWEERNRRKVVVVTDEESPFEWNQALLDVKEELAFIKKYKGGRLRNMRFKLQNPKEMLQSRSPSRSRTSLSEPHRRASDGGELDELKPASPHKKRGRSRSNSALAGAAMAGIVAGSIGASWSPVDRAHAEGAGPPWGNRDRSKSDLSKEVHAESSPKAVVAQQEKKDAATSTDFEDSSKQSDLKKEDDVKP